MNKKGLSDVITTVLIILLVIAAIVIIWGFVGPLITRTGQQINYQAECLNVEAKPTGCTTTTDATPVTTIYAQLSRNSTTIPIAKIVVTLTSPSGNVQSASIGVPTTLTSGSATFGGTSGTAAVQGSSASATVYLQKTDGSTFQCGAYVPALGCT